MNETMSRPLTQQERIEGLDKTNIPLTKSGTYFVETTTNLANKIVDMMVNTYGITECDHVFMHPVKSKDGRVVDFQLYMYFNTNRSRGSQTWSIRRFGGDNKGNRARDLGNGRVDLSGAFGTKTSNGGFELSESFKKTVGAVAVLNDNRQIVVRADKKDRSIGIVECNFFDILAMCLDIKTDDPFDFAIVECTPASGGRNSDLDYELQIIKHLTKNGQRRGKSGVNYEFRDRELLRG